MQQMTITTPALLFPAISLFMLAFTNRFLSLSARVRTLHDQFHESGDRSILAQIHNLRKRIYMIRSMQGFGVCSMLTCIVSMLFVGLDLFLIGELMFGASLIFLSVSMVFSFMEIRISVNALEILLTDMESPDAQKKTPAK